MDDAVLRASGIQTVENGKEVEFKPQICVRCKERNSPGSRFCIRCGTPFDEELLRLIDQTRAKTEDVMDLLLKDRKVKEVFERKIAELTAQSIYERSQRH